MGKYGSTILFLVMILAFSCQQEEAVMEHTVKAKIDNLHLLIFKEERRMETWTRDTLGLRKLSEYTLKESVSFPIGVFDLELSESQGQILLNKNKALRPSLQLEKENLAEPQTELLSILTTEDASTLNQLLKEANQNLVLIFPNDIRNGADFKPCINCPIWMPELYASLRLWLQKYSDTELKKVE